jgi:signal peptidase I
MRCTKSFALLLLCLALLTGCGSKGNGTTVVVTTGGSAQGGSSTQTPGVLLGVYRIPSRSMDPTLPLGDRVAVEAGAPRLGEIVVFHPPEGAAQEVCGSGTPISPGGAACAHPVPREERIKFIKRIVAGPGDTIKVIEGHVIRNGQREKDPYVRPCPGVSECNFPVPIKVPEGDWFLMGDNRGESDDSRFWGPVPASWIIGVVTGAPVNGV